MKKITNPKIGFKRFNGFSLIFDNPGKDSLSTFETDNKIMKLNCQVNNEQYLKFYDSLKKNFDEIILNVLQQNLLIFDLPSNTYHVTVWDGLNDSNKNNISQHYQPQLEKFLFSLPDFLRKDKQFTTLALSSPLVKNVWDIKFKFSKLSLFSKYALVAILEPANESANVLFKEIVKLRSILYDDYNKTLGLSNWNTNFIPHVSLAYFGNQVLGDKIIMEIENWSNIFLHKMEKLNIRFKNISLYGFIDMETFFKSS